MLYRAIAALQAFTIWQGGQWVKGDCYVWICDNQ